MQRTALLIACTVILYLPCEYCFGQSQRLTQPDLRRYAEEALRDRLVVVEPPEFSREQVTRTSRVLVVYMGDHEPKNISSNELLNEAVNAQFEVTIIRAFRNRRDMVRWWASTLAKVERQIQEMLNVVYTPNLTIEQKEELISDIHFRIQEIYQNHFVAWANIEGLSHFEKVAKEKRFIVTIVTVPADAQVQFVPAGRWKLHNVEKQLNPNTPDMEWEIAQTRELPLGGKFYFTVRFGDLTLPVIGPIQIEKDQVLTFTKKGLQR